eukprot:2407638-Heterocapsa_arctica.AAC.1
MDDNINEQLDSHGKAKQARSMLVDRRKLGSKRALTNQGTNRVKIIKFPRRATQAGHHMFHTLTCAQVMNMLSGARDRPL